MKILIKLCESFKVSQEAIFGVSLTATKNTFGTPGGGILENAYWVYEK